MNKQQHVNSVILYKGNRRVVRVILDQKELKGWGVMDGPHPPWFLRNVRCFRGRLPYHGVNSRGLMRRHRRQFHQG